MKKINLNSLVTVKLTQHGLDIYKAYYEKLNFAVPFLPATPTEPKLDEDGYWQTELWNFMHIFGNNLYMSAKPVIVDNDILIREIELEGVFTEAS